MARVCGWAGEREGPARRVRRVCGPGIGVGYEARDSTAASTSAA
ncbi:MAG TPA: hypothetical protein PK018_11190 [Candidatus Competibacter sp.]|nr:hypothetical protein [Candidatus Competibacter sp.]